METGSDNDDVKKARCFVCTAPLISLFTSPSSSKKPGQEAKKEQDKLNIGRANRDDGYLVDKKEIDLFALRYLLEIPEEKLELNGGGGSEGLDLCDMCVDDVVTAQKLYQNLVKILKQFRRIQRNVVEEILKTRREEGTGDGKWREFVRAHDYKFTGPFLICEEEAVKEEEEEVANVKSETDDSDGDEEEEEIEHDILTTGSPVPSDGDPLNFDSAEEFSSESEEDPSPIPFLDEGEEEDVEEDVKCPIPPLPITFVPARVFEFENPPPPEPATTSRRSGRKRKLETREYDGDMEIQQVSFVLPTPLSSSEPQAPEAEIPAPIAVTTHYCPKCFRPFKAKGSLTTHLAKVHKIGKLRKWPRRTERRVTRKLLLKCDLCYDRFPDNSHLTQHLSQDHGVTDLSTCPYPPCSRDFSSTFSLRRHYYINHRQSFEKEGDKTVIEKQFRYPYVCEICKRELKDIKALQDHLQQNHEGPGASSIPCPVVNCPEKLCSRQSVQVHIFLSHDLRQREKETIQKCPACSMSVEVPEMESHLKVSHGASKSIKCCHCPFLFSKSEYYIEHLYKAHRKSGLPFPCDICTEGHHEDDPVVTFPDHIELRKHYFEEHQIGEQYKCDLCVGEETRTFWTKMLLWNHVNHCHKRKWYRDNFPCDICSELDPNNDVTFKSTLTLEAHKIKVHGAEPIKCPHCEETFTIRTRFQAHVREVHKGIQKQGPVPCPEPECNGKLFSGKRQLIRHQETVHGERKHLCDHCGKGYPTQSQLKQHVEIVHLGLRPAVCEICGESFPSGNHLRRHKLIHTGERPYVCPECGQRFRQNSVLGRHLKSHKEKGDNFRPTGPMKHIRKRVQPKRRTEN